MKNPIPKGFHARRVMAAIVTVFAALLLFSQAAQAIPWNGIEPLKSRRADVERVLGQPTRNQPGQNGTLHFKVAGGTVTIVFIDARFIATKKLYPELEGTVRQVVLQHDNSSDTPESMNIVSNSAFERQEGQGGVLYRNLKDGIAYTFLGGKLKTTYYTPSAEEWTKAQKGT